MFVLHKLYKQSLKFVLDQCLRDHRAEHLISEKKNYQYRKISLKMRVCVFICLLAATLASAQKCGKLQSNIDDKNSNLPWAVKLRERKTNDVICTGTLISDQHVLFGNNQSFLNI